MPKFSRVTLMLIRVLWLFCITLGYSAWFYVNITGWNRFLDAHPVVATLVLFTTMAFAATVAYIPYSPAFTSKFWNHEN